jgi:hypothetical protein
MALHPLLDLLALCWLLRRSLRQNTGTPIGRPGRG